MSNKYLVKNFKYIWYIHKSCEGYGKFLHKDGREYGTCGNNLWYTEEDAKEFLRKWEQTNKILDEEFLSEDEMRIK